MTRITGLLVLLTFCTVLAACGGGTMGSSGSQNNVGPTAITNASSAATMTNRWASPSCAVQVALATNGEFRFAVTDTSGTTYSGGGTWVASGKDSATINFGGAGIFFLSVGSLAGIHGSTSQKSFTSVVTILSSNGTQGSGTCTFSLVDGAISL